MLSLETLLFRSYLHLPNFLLLTASCMSDLLSEPLRADEHQFATLKNGEKNHQRLQGQRHTRISDSLESNSTMTTNRSKESEAEIDISAGQKMLSAVSGSLLTSLLGRVAHDSCVRIKC